MPRFIYIIILITAAVFYPLYKDSLSFVILVSVAALPPLMLVHLTLSVRLIKCTPQKAAASVFKGGEGEVRLTLENKSPVPLSGVRVGVRITSLPTGETRRQTADIPLPARSVQTVTVGISPKNCGEARVYLEYVKIYDLLHLFSRKLFTGEGLIGRLCVIPKIEPKYASEAAELMKLTRETIAEASSDVNSDSGAFGDVSGYRDYIPGDKLSRLHHKLSARFDKDIVRIMSPDSSGHFLLTADLSADRPVPQDKHSVSGNGENTSNPSALPPGLLDERDKRLEKLISTAYYLSQEGAEVCVALPDNDLSEMMIGTVPALRCTNVSDCLNAAKALCGADFSGAAVARRADSQYMTVRIEDNDEETD
ncbi:MAG: DUF58 domain-containing protein [Ruminococcus sp.]|nr:DUF58 domain-containing protein [Ruminococcus sp.]